MSGWGWRSAAVEGEGDVAQGWLAAMEQQSPGAIRHARRVRALTLRLAGQVGYDPEHFVQLQLGALLHDVGKLKVPDTILRKAGPLTAEEYAQVRRHPDDGVRLLAPLANLDTVMAVVSGHHERWDGAGYPLGLAGDRIPWPARLTAVADVWDALRSNRPYRRAWPAERACQYVQEAAGRHFDPEVVAAFMRIMV
jgi:HD-GYP domain-containing protein (c-di-GMP phosphodiesterase class II)